MMLLAAIILRSSFASFWLFFYAAFMQKDLKIIVEHICVVLD